MEHYWYHSRNNGSVSNDDYPYTAVESGSCMEDGKPVVAQVETWGRITTDLLEVVQRLKEGPLTVAVSAGNDCWRFYKSGILSAEDECPSATIDHAVTLVGVNLEGDAKMRWRCTLYSSAEELA